MRLFIHTYFLAKNLQQVTITSLVTLSLLWLLAFPLQVNANNESIQEENREKLSDVQQAIAKQESNIFDTNKQRSSLEKQLKTDDLAIAKVAKAINNIEEKLSNTQKKITTLAAEKKSLTTAKTKQENLLAQQLRSAYTTGQPDYFK